MGIKDRLVAKSALIAPVVHEEVETTPRTPKTAPGALMHAMPLLKEKQAEIDAMAAEMERLRERVAEGAEGGVEIPISKLVEAPGRRRHMPAQKYAELRENLRRNKLIHPVVVRRTADEKFEIISGHHRADAYREIGRDSIRAVVDDGSEEEANDGAFFANLMQSDLTDFEKYMGFKARAARHPNLTRAAMAEQAGLTEAMVSYIFSFDHLPPDVLSMLAQRPSLLGANAGYALAALAKQGKSEQVIDAVKRLADGAIDQSQAVKLAAVDPSKKKAVTATPVTMKIKSGKALYCELRRAKNVVRLQFQSDEEAARVQDAITRVLETESRAKNANAEQDGNS
ncbi:chromosome partitioning protein ParB [Burkholderia sp. SJ98]|uniref:ParB/RepB/Spo0J family partition protein n=1 Tax=Caballeronia zhejiangensis TaxID=871203 RepID=UPI00025B9FE9|nr:ParB/RepB/Spo0J family partition protein [Caballeronia zhejiangensis]EKS72401.1 chromosome partitioning protein ParB [Burkholderia sp. SJ98]